MTFLKTQQKIARESMSVLAFSNEAIFTCSKEDLDTLTEQIINNVVEEIEGITIKGNRVGEYEMGEKVIDFANEVLTEFKKNVIATLTK